MSSRYWAGSVPDPASADRPEDEDSPRLRRSRAPILVVEDDAAIRETLADILQYEGYAVVTAASGGAALVALEAGCRPCLVLTDLMMAGGTGWELRDRMLGETHLRGIPLIVISALDDVDRQASQLRATAHLRKPIDVMELLRLVGQHAG